MAHVGVLEELVNAGIEFDVIIGCSAGSIVGALYADSMDMCVVKDAVKNLKTDKILDIDIWDCRFGLSQGTAMTRMLDDKLNATCFSELKIPFIAVATDLNSGELVPIGSGDLIKAVRASTSIPLVFVPVEMHGRVLVDGGIINPVPVSVARHLGAELVIAVDLCELLPKTFPTNLFGVASRSTEIAFMWQNTLSIRDANINIRPKMCGVGTFNDKAKMQLYMAGREAAREMIPQIKELLSQLPPKEECEYRNTRIVQPMCSNPDHPAFDICFDERW
jgi:NTE family protein